MSAVSVTRLTKHYGGMPALDGVNLDIEPGEFVTLLGASGSGKTTCLRIIAGFTSPDAGRVLLDGKDITRLAPNKRETGMVFQHYALFPHLTVAENIAFGLRVRRVSRHDRTRMVRDALELVHLETLAAHYPGQLSGGQKQRVALARAIVIKPRLLLLDEPLSALDLRLREKLQSEIRAIQKRLGITTLFVTHDQNEALTMSDRVVVMRGGRVEQVAAPATLYAEPATLHVARFIGRMNFLRAELAGVTSAGLLLRAHADPTRPHAARNLSGGRPVDGTPMLLALRPEHLRPVSSESGRLQVEVEKITYAGEGWVVTGRSRTGDEISLRLTPADRRPTLGETVSLDWRDEDALGFADQSGHSPTSPLKEES